MGYLGSSLLNRGLIFCASVAFAILLSGCASSKPPKPAVLKNEVVASEYLNPNRRNAPQPVRLHIFYLKQDEAFGLANFNQLVSDQPDAIAADLIRKAVVLVGPGETVELDEEFDKETQFIGLVGEFTNIGNATWRTLVAIPEKGWKDRLNPFSGKKLLINLNSAAVNAEIVDD